MITSTQNVDLKKKRRHINLSSIATALELTQKGLVSAMPGLHAFTGCDFTTLFKKKRGKVKPLQVLQKDTEGTLIKLFSKLSCRDEPDQTKAEEFICSLYGKKGSVKDFNKARYAKLLQMIGKTNQVRGALWPDCYYCEQPGVAKFLLCFFIMVFCTY